MADPIQLGRVILPWAQHGVQPRSEADNVERDRHKDVAGEVRVTDDAVRVSDDRPMGFVPARTDNRDSPLVPPLPALGLPYEPGPDIPEEDRRVFSRDDLVALAVAVDVLATRTRVVEDDPTILHGLADALLDVGELGGVDELAVERLLQHAASPTGHNRAILARRLSACLQRAMKVDAPEQATDSTPSSVAAGMRRVETAAEVVVKEAHLLLDAREDIEYQKV